MSAGGVTWLQEQAVGLLQEDEEEEARKQMGKAFVPPSLGLPGRNRSLVVPAERRQRCAKQQAKKAAVSGEQEGTLQTSQLLQEKTMRSKDP